MFCLCFSCGFKVGGALLVNDGIRLIDSDVSVEHGGI